MAKKKHKYRTNELQNLLNEAEEGLQNASDFAFSDPKTAHEELERSYDALEEYKQGLNKLRKEDGLAPITEFNQLCSHLGKDTTVNTFREVCIDINRGMTGLREREREQRNQIYHRPR